MMFLALFKVICCPFLLRPNLTFLLYPRIVNWVVVARNVDAHNGKGMVSVVQVKLHLEVVKRHREMAAARQTEFESVVHLNSDVPFISLALFSFLSSVG